jgi:hypothetical protein
MQVPLPAIALSCLVVVASACSAHAGSPETLRSTYVCSDGRSFTVVRDAQHATVQFADGRYRLVRRSSSIGPKYASNDATLLIDGDFAAFVTKSVTNLESCLIWETTSI